jgi:predicted HicB family RNase H-like nuclease
MKPARLLCRASFHWSLGVVADMKEKGETPPEALAERDYSGEFKVRVPPSVHRALVLAAAEEGVSVNRVVSARLARG